MEPIAAPPAAARFATADIRVVVVRSPEPRKRNRPRPDARRARAVLAWAAALFVLGHLAAAVALDLGYCSLRDPLYDDKERLLKQTPHRVVMLGSSRTVYALRGDIAAAHGTAVFNFGLPGAGPLTELIALRRLLADGHRPDTLLVEVLPPVLAGQVALPEVERLVSERLRHDDLPLVERLLPHQRSWRSEWWQSWPLPSYAHRVALQSRAAPSLMHYSLRLDWFVSADASGWVPPPWPERTPDRYRAALAQTRTEYATYLDGFRLGGPSPKALRELLTMCQRETIPVTLVLLPEGSDFRSWYTPEARRQIETFLDILCREFAVAVVDASAWVPDDEFGDGHHLLPAGAERFSARLGRELLDRFKFKSASPSSR